MCVNAGFIASDWAWLHQPMLEYWALTFEPHRVALGVWQEVKGEAMSVNEALYGGAIEGWTEADDGLKRMWLR